MDERITTCGIVMKEGRYLVGLRHTPGSDNDSRWEFIGGKNRYGESVADTLEREYLRDKNQGLPIQVPENYYPQDDDTQPPVVCWRGHAHLLFSNWLNYFVYQTTPYDIMAVGRDSTPGEPQGN